VQYRTLGATGIEVSTLALGTMMFGPWGNPDEAECQLMVDQALAAGVNLFDTADVYAHGVSEEILARTLKGRRDSIVLATKGHNEMPGDPLDRNRSRNSRVWITRAVEASLRRLGTDYIDLYQVHRPDPRTDIDETLGVLSDLIRQGKIRAIGTSSFPAEELVEAQWVARDRNRERFTTEQPSYSILNRYAESSVLPVAQRHRLGVLIWSPLNGGWLTGKYQAGQALAADSRGSRESEHFDYRLDDVRDRKLAAVKELTTIAEDAGLSLIHLALGFVLAHQAVTTAIMGPRTPAQLAGQLEAADVVLSPQTLDRIDAVIAPGTGLNPDDVGYVPPALTDPTTRRR
jgi:aryl-alcohol dehydrogenase-like predicted oxidoreductase